MGSQLPRHSGSGAFKRLSLGRYGDPGAKLEEARARAGELTGAARQKIDLVANEAEARAAKARSMTLGKLGELYVSRRITGRLRSAASVESILNAFPLLPACLGIISPNAYC
jgi:hypothetical protein